MIVVKHNLQMMRAALGTQASILPRVGRMPVFPGNISCITYNSSQEGNRDVQREVDEITLTRYARYLIVQNGDPRKPEVDVY